MKKLLIALLLLLPATAWAQISGFTNVVGPYEGYPVVITGSGFGTGPSPHKIFFTGSPAWRAANYRTDKADSTSDITTKAFTPPTQLRNADIIPNHLGDPAPRLRYRPVGVQTSYPIWDASINNTADTYTALPGLTSTGSNQRNGFFFLWGDTLSFRKAYMSAKFVTRTLNIGCTGGPCEFSEWGNGGKLWAMLTDDNINEIGENCSGVIQPGDGTAAEYNTCGSTYIESGVAGNGWLASSGAVEGTFRSNSRASYLTLTGAQNPGAELNWMIYSMYRDSGPSLGEKGILTTNVFTGSAYSSDGPDSILFNNQSCCAGVGDDDRYKIGMVGFIGERTGASDGTNTDTATVTLQYLTDIYIQPETHAHVVLGDNATYASCTWVEHMKVFAWSDASIVAELNKGTFFEDGDSAYVHVILDDSSVLSYASPLVWGGDPPAEPERPSKPGKDIQSLLEGQ